MDDEAPTIISHYLIEGLLGIGGMGVVYSGVDQRDGSPVAVKLLHRHLTEDPAFHQRFEQEAHLAALLRSPYTVHLLDFGIAEGRAFMVMEYIDGETLGHLLGNGPLPAGRALRIAAQVARALEEAHARGVVHRDIKPENILLRGDSVKVADFGIARRANSATVSVPGSFYGTISYAAPEQLTGDADHRTDIYAVGATLFHMLAGRPPFVGSAEEVFPQIARAAPPLDLLKETPDEVVSIVSRCLAKGPDARYSSATELEADLEHAARRLSTSPISPASEPSAATVAFERAGAQPLVTMRLTPRRRSRTAGRLRSATFDLEVRNDSDKPVELQLVAADRSGGCRFALPAKLVLGSRSTAGARVKVSPAKRRWRGKTLTRIFTVFGSSGDEGPPVSATARFEDLPYGWLPYGGVLAIGSIAAIVAGGALAAGIVGPGTQPEPLKIGVLAPFSGQAADWGPAYLNAARIAVGEINADGGVLGQPVALVQGDSAAQASVGLPAARRLIQEEGVQAIIGDESYSTTQEVANQVTNPGGIVQITPLFLEDASARTIPEGVRLENTLPFLFQTGVNPSAEGAGLADLVKQGNYRKVCSITSSGDFNALNPGTHFKALSLAIDDALKSNAGDVQLVAVPHTPVQAPEQQAGAAAELDQCAGADLIVINTPVEGDANPTSPILEEALRRALQPLILTSPQSLYECRDIRANGCPLNYVAYLAQNSARPPDEAPHFIFDYVGWDAASGVKGTAIADAKSAQTQKFDQEYKDQFGGDPEAVPDLRRIYDAVYLVALAAQKAGSTEPDAIRAAMRDIANAPGAVVKSGPGNGGFLQGKQLIARGEDIDFEGMSGPIEFDEGGQNVRGVVDIWHADLQAHGFVTDKEVVVDLAAAIAATPVPSTGSEVTSSVFVPPVTLKVSPGFAVLQDHSPIDFYLERTGSDSGPDAYLSFSSPTSVYNPTSQVAEPVPADLMSWLETNSEIQVIEPSSELTVGGHQGKQIVVKRAGTGERVLFQVGPAQIVLLPQETAKFFVFELDGKTILIAAGPFGAASFEEALPDIEAMVTTMRFGAAPS